MINGFATFKCQLCKHSVNTREFSGQNGSCRTQAARAMKEHATAAHGCPMPVSLHDAQMWYAHKTLVSQKQSAAVRYDT
jgi:hypothetical protein